MPIFLALQATYEYIEVGIFQNTVRIDFHQEDKKTASKTLVSIIDQLLIKNGIALTDISFIAANQGPAPFTSLRVVITTVNGINFARQTPLMPINGLKAFLGQKEFTQHPTILALLNAYGQDFYYGLKEDQSYDIGCVSKNEIIDLLKQYKQDRWYCIGNGVSLLEKDLNVIENKELIIPTPTPQFVSLNAIAQEAYNAWQDKENVCNQIIPLYLKEVL